MSFRISRTGRRFPILMRVLDGALPLRDIHVLVSDRDCVPSGGGPRGARDYGRVSVMAQNLCSVKILRRMSAGNFFPKPQVSSAWTRLTPHQDLDLDLISIWLKSIAGAAFAKRRKQAQTSGLRVGFHREGKSRNRKLVQGHLQGLSGMQTRGTGTRAHGVISQSSFAAGLRPIRGV